MIRARPDRRKLGEREVVHQRRLTSKGARRISAMVARDEAHAVGFWDRAPGWEHDRRWIRYVKDL